MEPKFIIKEAFAFGWEKFKQNWKFFILAFLAVIPLYLAYAYVSGNKSEFENFTDVAMYLGFQALIAFLTLGFYNVLFKIHDGQLYKFEMIFKEGSKFTNYIVGYILYGLVCIAGFILFIIPGIIWSIKYGQMLYLIAEYNMKPIEAMKLSGKMTQGSKWNICLFIGWTFVLSLVGFVCLGVGLFVTSAIILMAQIYIYKKLSVGMVSAVKAASVVAEPVVAKPEVITEVEVIEEKVEEKSEDKK